MRQRTTRIRPHRRQRRGMALAGTMLVLFGIMTVMLLGSLGLQSGGSGSGVMANTDNAVQLSRARLQSVAAFNLAESGVEYTLQWLNQQPAPPNISAAYAPPLWGATSAGNPARAVVTPDPNFPGNTFSVVIYPDPGNNGNDQKKYLIESVGVSGGLTQIVQAYIEVTSLSKWLVLVDKWPANNWWVSGLSTFDGPVHDNNSDGRNEDVYWKSTATSPMWTYTGSDAYNVSGNGVNWWKDNWYNAGAPQSDSDWKKILAGGQNTLQTNTDKVTFPASSQTQMNAALNGATPPAASAPVGVTVPTGGGLYIHGDVQQMTLSVDNSGNQVIKVQQTDSNGNPYTTTVTLNASSSPGSTQVHVDYMVPNGNSGTYKAASSDQSYAGMASGEGGKTFPTNGVVYCDGNIGSQGDPKTGGLAGTVADNTYDASGALAHVNSLSVVTDASKNCNIDGNLVYNTARQKDASGNYLPENQDPNFTKYAGTLGVVSNTILITTQDASGNAITNLEVDGSILAYNLYDVDQLWTRPIGTWENMGGYLSANMGYFGVGDEYGNMYSGMATNFNYDARMRNTPPPYFPTTGSQYDVISWQRVSSTLQ
ncbi:MAG: hypothetical protein JO250_11685 [Armatimonadetes bacterium]|nr:hypothetical protein [Armatimonadota bacterium]